MLCHHTAQSSNQYATSTLALRVSLSSPLLASPALPIFPFARSYAVLSTLSSAKATQGFPQSSVVEAACDGSGRPFFALSSLSAHTADIKADGRAAVTIKSPSFRVRSNAVAGTQLHTPRQVRVTRAKQAACPSTSIISDIEAGQLLGACVPSWEQRGRLRQKSSALEFGFFLL